MFYEGLRLWEARFVVFYKGLRLWEAHLYVFYVSGRLSGGRPSNQPVSPGWSAKEKPSRAWGEGRGRGGGGAGFDECIEDSGSGRLNLSCFTRV